MADITVQAAMERKRNQQRMLSDPEAWTTWN